MNGDTNIFSGTSTQLIATISGTLFAISDGMSYGWTAPMTLYLISPNSHIPTTKHEAEFLEILLMMGSFVGLPITIYLVNKIGRKRSLLLAATLSLIGWIIVALANKLIYIQITRVMFGVAANTAFVAGPIYVAEIAENKIRGFLSSIIYLMMLLGFIVIYSVGPYTPFYMSSVIAGVLMVIDIATFSFMPESPHYLIYNNRHEEAAKSLQYFRPNKDISKELEDITNSVQRQKTEKNRVQDMFLVKSNRRAFIAVALLNIGQHFAAISVILMNLHVILEAADSIYIDSSIAAIIFSVVMLISAGYASFQVDKYGRKALLIISSVLTGICLLAMAVYFHLKHNGYDVQSASWIPIVSVMVYAGAFKFGLGIVPIIVTAEIFSAKMKAIGMTLSDLMYVISAMLSVELYQRLSDRFGIHSGFYVFAISSFIMALFTIFYLPETKGKSLEEIQFLLKGKKHLKDYQEKEKINTLIEKQEMI